MSIGAIAAVLSMAVIAPSPGAAAQGPRGADAQKRYDEARQLMQHSRYPEAAEAYRDVADSGEASVELRAQALFASGLMLQNAREYERAAETYREVEHRFPETQFAKRAEFMVNALEEGGQGRWIEFRRRQDAASDELLSAQTLGEREGLRAARSGFERAAGLLADILRDFPEHPQAANVAVTLGNAHMTLLQFAAARADYERAIALSRSRSTVGAPHAPDVDSIVLDAEERLAEAIRSLRRQRLTRTARALLAGIGLGVVSLCPWRAADRLTLRLGASLALGTLLLAAFAMAASYCVRAYVDPNSPIDMAAAGLLVALPGLTGEIVALALVSGLRARPRWPVSSTASVAAALAAIAALAVATCLVDAFALFPVLDALL